MGATPFDGDVTRRCLAYAGAMNRGGWKQYIREDLTSRQYQIMELRYVAGLSQKEIAKRLKVSPSTVSRTLKRAETRLKKAIRYLG